MNLIKLRILLNKVNKLLYTQLTSLYDRLLEKFASASNQKDEKLIIFAGESLAPRVERLARQIRKHGFRTILVCHKHGYVEKFAGDTWDDVRLYRNSAHLKRIIRSLPTPYLYHCFIPKSRYIDLARAEFRAPWIIDVQDIYTIYYEKDHGIRWLYKELPHEENLLRNTHGVLANSLEVNEAYRQLGIKEKPPAIYFPLYCQEEKFRFPEGKSTDEFHFVYAGNIAGSHRDVQQYGAIQLLWLARLLNKQKIHLHIYPSPSTLKADYEEYYRVMKDLPYLHMHESVSQAQLSKELEQYHFGLLPFFSNSNQNRPEKYKYATTLKLFNYIEAGLPIIVSRDLTYQSWMVQRYKAGLAISRADLDNIHLILASTPYEHIVEALIRNRKELSIEKNAERVINFYNQVTGK